MESTPRIKEILGSNLAKEPYKYKPTEMGGGASSSRFLGLPLPLLPDISKSEIMVGKDDPILGVLGIRQRGDTMVNLWKGPNKKSNRYLQHQYIRMLESIGGTLNPSNKVGLDSKTAFDIDYPKRVGGDKDSFMRKISPIIHWTFKLRELSQQELSRGDRKALALRTDTMCKHMEWTYWWIHRLLD